ncbi:MAG: hypothetical protein ACERKV_13405 [Clostridiaceae bacterium]
MECSFLSTYEEKVECFIGCPFYNEIKNQECPFRILENKLINNEKYENVMKELAALDENF